MIQYLLTAAACSRDSVDFDLLI